MTNLKTTTVECSLLTCTNQIIHRPSDKRKREYCSNACKQKAYRLRNLIGKNRNKNFVTVSTYNEVIAALEDLTSLQLNKLNKHIEATLRQRSIGGSTGSNKFLYFRKGNGVTHLAFPDTNLFCNRDMSGMTEVDGQGQKICHRCVAVRERNRW